MFKISNFFIYRISLLGWSYATMWLKYIEWEKIIIEILEKISTVEWAYVLLASKDIKQDPIWVLVGATSHQKWSNSMANRNVPYTAWPHCIWALPKPISELIGTSSPNVLGGLREYCILMAKPSGKLSHNTWLFGETMIQIIHAHAPDPIESLFLYPRVK